MRFVGCILLCALFQSCYSISFHFDVFENGTTADDLFIGVAVQNDFLFAIGNSAGSFYGPNIGDRDIILGKYHVSNFTFVTGIQIGTSNADVAQAIVAHAVNPVLYGCGIWNYYNSSSTTSTGDGTIFAVNSTNLQILWRTDISDPSGYTWLWGLSLDTIDNQTLYAGGYTNASSLYNQTGAGFSEVMVKINSTDGSLLWVRVLGTSVQDRILAIAVDQSGFIYGAGTGSSDTDIDCALCKVDSNGNQVYYKIFGASLVKDYATGVATDHFGGVYVLGVSYANYTRTGNVYPIPSSQQLLTVWSIKTEDTSFNWVSQLSVVGGSFVNTSQLIFGSDGLLYTTGWTGGVSVNGSLNTGSSPTNDGLITAWDADGNLKYVSMLGSSSDDALYGICMYNQTIYLAGVTKGNWATNYTYLGSQNDVVLVRAVHNETPPSPSATPFVLPLPSNSISDSDYIGSGPFIGLITVGAFVVFAVCVLCCTTLCSCGKDCWKSVLECGCCSCGSDKKKGGSSCCNCCQTGCCAKFTNMMKTYFNKFTDWFTRHCCFWVAHPHTLNDKPLYSKVKTLHYFQTLLLAIFMVLVILFWSGWYLYNPPNKVAFYREDPFETPDIYVCNPQQDPNYDLVPVNFASYQFTALLETEGRPVDETQAVTTNVTVFDQYGCLKFPSFLFKDLNNDPYRTVLDIDQELSCSVTVPGCSATSPGYVVQYLFMSHRSKEAAVINSDVTYLSAGLNIITFWVEKSTPADGFTEWFYPTSAYLIPGTSTPSCNQTTCLFRLQASLRLRSGNIIAVKEAQDSDYALEVLVSTGSFLGTVGTITAVMCCCLKRKLFSDDKLAWFEPELMNMLFYHHAKVHPEQPKETELQQMQADKNV